MRHFWISLVRATMLAPQAGAQPVSLVPDLAVFNAGVTT